MSSDHIKRIWALIEADDESRKRRERQDREFDDMLILLYLSYGTFHGSDDSSDDSGDESDSEETNQQCKRKKTELNVESELGILSPPHQKREMDTTKESEDIEELELGSKVE
jgi:hypothetical protein